MANLFLVAVHAKGHAAFKCHIVVSIMHLPRLYPSFVETEDAGIADRKLWSI